MTGQWVVDSLKLCLGFVEQNHWWTLAYLVVGGIPFSIRIGIK